MVIAGRRREPLQAVAEANPGIEYLSLIIVERVKRFRFAERDGVYDQIYPGFNQAMTAALTRSGQ